MAVNPLNWIDNALADLESHSLRRELAVRRGAQLPNMVDLNGQRLVNFGSNDYLGLAADPRIAGAARDATPTEGWGSGASPLVTGRNSLHDQLETELAKFEGTEAALLFPTGFAANVGTISSLVGSEDIVFSDAKNHASIIDGCRLSGAQVEVYAHCNAEDLSLRLESAKEFRRCLIVTDALFSMDGDLAPLVDIAELADEHNAMLMIDETHATGVFGAKGRGVAEHLRVKDRIHVCVGSFSKALGSIGGFVAGSRSLINWLVNRARPYVFSTATPAAICAAGLAALEVVRAEPHRRVQLLDRSAALRVRLKSIGCNVGASESQIIPVILCDPERTMKVSAALREKGLFVPGIRPPSVPPGESLLRISLSYDHTDESIDRLVEGLEVGR